MILSKTLRTPICIDPQFKAIEWIKVAHQRQNNVKFLRFDADDTIGELLKAIALGEIVVFEDVHAHIDPTLMDLLEIKLLGWFPSFSLYHFQRFTTLYFRISFFSLSFFSFCLHCFYFIVKMCCYSNKFCIFHLCFFSTFLSLSLSFSFLFLGV